MRKSVALVVGGSGQIGRHLVDAFVDRGYQTICISRTKREEENPHVKYVCGDMSSLDEIKKCHSFIAGSFQKIDVLVNVLGKNTKDTLEDITEEIWHEVVDSNLKSVFFLCRTFYDLLQKDSRGAVINFSSTAGIRGLPQSPHYIASKAGVIELTKFFAKIYAPKIQVNCIAPGFVLTENHKPENYCKYDTTTDSIPLKRMTDIQDIINAVMFLVKSKSITGHTLVVDGGMVL
jgi:3-oxoacyl-[acyl-carrier protein] reductase